MTPDRWRQIESLFVQVAECAPPERDTLLDRICQGDQELRREVESLLACDAPEKRLLEIPAGAESEPETPGRRIGPYRLMRLLGHGGMGAVHLAVRDDDHFQKEVAIKILKRGMDTDAMLLRFRQERQILANLEHPFIARLLDGGSTPDGLPYFVMEYVDGLPITNYCRDMNLNAAQTLRLFRMVCEAVQYAHQNLVVHRDLKPGNILITKEGIPKLLDFGIAKAIAPDRSETAQTMTQKESRMLTPAYASPEQVMGLPISTATDIYALGAVLYELLTRQRAHRFASEQPAEMERVICEVEPDKPSAAVRRNAVGAPRLQQLQSKELAGDVDTILLTAMRKDPLRRYASVAEFSDDIRRHLEGRPITAREDTLLYRTGKFVRRNKLAVTAGVLVTASLIGGMAAATYQARRSERRFQIVRGLANTMLFDLYGEMERLPGSTALRAATIRSVVKYLDDLARDGSQDPGLALEIAQAYERVGSLEGVPFQSNLGRGPEALRTHLKALAIYERLVNRGERRREAIAGLIDSYLRVGQMNALLGNPAAAAEYTRKAAAAAGEAFARGDPEIPPSTQMNVYSRLADAEYEHGSAEGELSYYRKALEVGQKWAAAERRPVVISGLRDAHRNVGSALARGGDLMGAREAYRRAQEAAEELLGRTDATPEHKYNAISVYTSLGDLLAAPDDPNFGDRAGALALYGKALTIAESVAASDAQDVNGRRIVAACYWRFGMVLVDDQPMQALEYNQKSARIAEDLHAIDPLNAEYRYHASRGYLGLGESLRRLGRYEEAVQSLNRAVEHQKAIEAVSPERIWNLRVLSRAYLFMGRALFDSGHPDRALSALRESLAVADRMLTRAPSSLSHQLDRAEALEALGAYHQVLAGRAGANQASRLQSKAEARAFYQQGLAIWQDWTRRNVAAPYAGLRERQAAALLASIDRI